MNKKQYAQDNKISLQGKAYLEVKFRVEMLRKEHPEWTIRTMVLEIGEEYYMKAEIADGPRPLATAHKRVVKGAKGPAGKFPLETAETGAIGRACALMGYGTLAGDLEEYDQIADAPHEDTAAPSKPDDEVSKILKLVRCTTSTSQVDDLIGQYGDAIKEWTASDRKKAALAFTAARSRLEEAGQ